MPRGAKPTCECGVCQKCRRRAYQREYQRRWARENDTPEKRARRAEATRAWREENPERDKQRWQAYQQTDAYKEYQRRYRDENRVTLNRKNLERYHASDKTKWRAREAVAAALRRGDLKRESCLFCDDPKVHAHHHDYDKPLDVTWLCAIHHGLAHGKVRIGGR